jgi:hypothetical protein
MIEDMVEKISSNINVNVNTNVNANVNTSKNNDIEQIENILYEFKRTNNFESTATKLQRYSKYCSNIIDIIMYNVLEEIEKERSYIVLIKNIKFITNDQIIESIDKTAKNIDEISLDIPCAKANLLKFITSLNTAIHIISKDNILTNIILTLSDE